MTLLEYFSLTQDVAAAITGLKDALESADSPDVKWSCWPID